MNQAIGRFFRHGGNTTAANGGLNNNNSSKNVSKQIKFNESRLQPLSSLGHALDASRYGLTGGGEREMGEGEREREEESPMISHDFPPIVR